MTFFRHDIRDAWRTLARNRSYSLVVVLTLGLGIGVNAAVFTVVDAVFLEPLPYPDAERLVRVAEWPRTGGNFTMSPAAYLRWRTEATSFTQFEARLSASFALLDGASVEELRGAGVTPGYFDLLGIGAAHGRTFVVDDARADATCTAVITHRLWARRLGADATRLGRPLRFSGTTCTLIGVLPASSVFDRVAPDVYVPMTFAASDATNHGRMLTVLARLSPQTSLEQARAEMAALAAPFNTERGEAGRGWTTAVTPLRDVVIRSDSRTLALLLSGTVIVVLIVACLNVAGLSLSRTAIRRREIAIRTALGASRSRVFRHLLVESLLLALCGAMTGVLMASWMVRGLTALAPAGVLPTETVASVDGRTLLFGLAVSICAGLLFGIVPALRAASAAPASALASGGRTGGPSRATSGLHQALLVIQVALAMVLVVAAASLAISLGRLVRVDPGFTGRQAVTLRVALPAGRHASDEAAARLFEDLTEAFRRVPGVAYAGAVTSLPLDGWLFGTTFQVQGEAVDPAGPTSAHVQHVTPGYFEALGIPLETGRSFTRADRQGAPPVAIVNETFERRFVSAGGALGRQLRMGSRGELREIVGVLRDVKTGGLDDDQLATPEIYVPHQQSPVRTMFVAVSATSGDPSRLLPDLRSAARAIDPELPLGAPMSMDERLGASVRQERFRTAMIGSSAMLALLLACLGVYAIRSQAVSSRIREMGIRLALGATPGEVLRMVLSQGLTQVAVGAALGLGAAFWLARVVEPWLFATRTTDPRVLGASAVLLAAAALVASWFPARRAAAVDPLLLLREE